MSPSARSPNIPLTFDELLAAVATEPARVVNREVRAAAPDLLRKVARPGGMLLTDLIAELPARGETKRITCSHVLERGLDADAISTWEQQNPAFPLPADLRSLLLRVNGIHLWADTQTGRAYTGLSPLREWRGARVAMYGASADPALLGDHYLAISYHQDGGAYVVLDVHDRLYFLMDPAGPDRTSMIARGVPELLGWLWTNRLSPSEG